MWLNSSSSSERVWRSTASSTTVLVRWGANSSMKSYMNPRRKVPRRKPILRSEQLVQFRTGMALHRFIHHSLGEMGREQLDEIVHEPAQEGTAPEADLEIGTARPVQNGYGAPPLHPPQSW